MRGPSEIRQKSSIIIKMTISKNMLPLISPTPFRAGRPDRLSFTRSLYYRTNRPVDPTIMVPGRVDAEPIPVLVE
jgi:hypothetical protein